MNYDWNWIKNGQHILTIRNRETGWAKQKRVWNEKVLQQALSSQKESEDIFITKYPKNRLVDTIVLDFDSKDDPSKAYKDAKRLHKYLAHNDINSIIVESGSKGNHLYIQTAPFLFKDTDIRKVSNWNSYFNAFVCFLIHNSSTTYETLDKVNFTSGLNGNIRLLGSIHPSTGRTCQIIEGSFNSDYVVTELQDEAQRKAFLKIEIQEQDAKQKQLKKARVIADNDPIANNDLREIFREITGDIKIYPRGYGYCSCPVHGADTHYSLLVNKEWFSCSACDFKGNIYTLRKMGLVEFDGNGVARL